MVNKLLCCFRSAASDDCSVSARRSSTASTNKLGVFAKHASDSPTRKYSTRRKLSLITRRTSDEAVPAPVRIDPWPITIQIHANLRSTIHYHRISSPNSGDFSCWTYVSQGLQSVGQKEVVFTLRQRFPEAQCDFHRDPLTWFEMLYNLAAEGRVVDTFERTRFISTHFLGRSDFQYILYGLPVEVPGLPEDALPAERLHAIAVTREEAITIKYCGMMRVLSHLGLSERWFPYPPWIDRDRPSCISMHDMEGSVRGHVLQVMPVWGLSAFKKGSEIVLHVPAESEEDLRTAVQQTTLINAFALDSVLSAEADSCFYWKHGQPKPEIYGSGDVTDEPKCINFSFLAFCPQQKQDSTRLIEDGFGVFLTDGTWKRVRSAIAKHKDITVAVGGGNVFRLEWADGRTGRSRDQ